MELNKTQHYLDSHSFDDDTIEVLSYHDAKAATKLAVYEYIKSLFDRNPPTTVDLWEMLTEDLNIINKDYKNVIKKWM